MEAATTLVMRLCTSAEIACQVMFWIFAAARGGV